MERYDLCVIGSGPAGQRAAVQAAKVGRRVAVIERREVVGGVAINTGTIPSKALREAVLHIVGAGQGLSAGPVAPATRVAAHRPTIEELTFWCQHVVKSEIDVVRDQLSRNEIDLFTGTAAFEGPNTIAYRHGNEVAHLEADHVLLAVGTRPARPVEIPFDEQHIVDADGLFGLRSLPRTMIVVGGGVIGTEYASMMQALGVKVTLIERRPHLMEFLDPEIAEALQFHLRRAGMTLRLGEQVVKAGLVDAGDNARTPDGKLVEVALESGKLIRGEVLLYSVGRQGCTSDLALDAVGLSADDRGRIAVNEHFQTEARHIYAAGDVIGFPALASTSMEQGRLAACHMFGIRSNASPELFPFGIYAIPEISMVGWSEEKLTEHDVPYETGVAHYREIARGQLVGDHIGMLKLLVHQESRQVLGVHCIGTGATELIHIGQAVMSLNGTVDYFVDTVFNYPTLAECYKVAAHNAVNKMLNL